MSQALWESQDEKDTITWAPFGLAPSSSCPVAPCGVELEEAPQLAPETKIGGAGASLLMLQEDTTRGARAAWAALPKTSLAFE